MKPRGVARPGTRRVPKAPRSIGEKKVAEHLRKIGVHHKKGRKPK